MPLYSYKCLSCGNEFDEICKVKDRKQYASCPICGGKGDRIIVSGHGGVQTDTPAWIDNEVRVCLGEPVQTRTELNRVLKEKNLEPAC